jgi:hypothetical protein
VLSSSQKHGLHHLYLWTNTFLQEERNSIAIVSTKENQFTLGKPILTNEQILQIESEGFTSVTNRSESLHFLSFPFHRHHRRPHHHPRPRRRPDSQQCLAPTKKSKPHHRFLLLTRLHLLILLDGPRRSASRHQHHHHRLHLRTHPLSASLRLPSVFKLGGQEKEKKEGF